MTRPEELGVNINIKHTAARLAAREAGLQCKTSQGKVRLREACIELAEFFQSLNETIRCIHDGACGIHLPQHFITDSDQGELLASGASAEDIAIVLEGADHEHYWEAWDSLLADIGWKENGSNWTLHQDGDLFAVREDHDFDGGL